MTKDRKIFLVNLCFHLAIGGVAYLGSMQETTTREILSVMFGFSVIGGLFELGILLAKETDNRFSRSVCKGTIIMAGILVATHPLPTYLIALFSLMFVVAYARTEAIDFAKKSTEAATEKAADSVAP